MNVVPETVCNSKYLTQVLCGSDLCCDGAKTSIHSGQIKQEVQVVVGPLNKKITTTTICIRAQYFMIHGT